MFYSTYERYTANMDTPGNSRTCRHNDCDKIPIGKAPFCKACYNSFPDCAHKNCTNRAVPVHRGRPNTTGFCHIHIPCGSAHCDGKPEHGSKYCADCTGKFACPQCKKTKENKSDWKPRGIKDEQTLERWPLCWGCSKQPAVEEVTPVRIKVRNATPELKAEEFPPLGTQQIPIQAAQQAPAQPMMIMSPINYNRPNFPRVIQTPGWTPPPMINQNVPMAHPQPTQTTVAGKVWLQKLIAEKQHKAPQVQKSPREFQVDQSEDVQLNATEARKKWLTSKAQTKRDEAQLKQIEAHALIAEAEKIEAEIHTLSV